MTEATLEPISATTETAGSNRLLPSSLTKLSLSTVNRALTVLAAVVLFFFVGTLLLGAFRLMNVGHRIRGLEAKGAQASATSESQRVYAKPAPADPALSNRNIFQPAGAAVAGSGEAAPSGGTAAYRLVGISSSKNPEDTYVMIENTQTKLTYFLQYGQSVEGLELERILEDKVIVKIGGKAVEFE